jgi:hypothetical protein
MLSDRLLDCRRKYFRHLHHVPYEHGPCLGVRSQLACGLDLCLTGRLLYTACRGAIFLRGKWTGNPVSGARSSNLKIRRATSFSVTLPMSRFPLDMTDAGTLSICPARPSTVRRLLRQINLDVLRSAAP